MLRGEGMVKGCTLLLVAVLIAGASLMMSLKVADVAYAAEGSTLGAQSAKNLKQLGVKFDLKKNEAVKTVVHHAGDPKLTKQPFKVKLTDYKVTKASKKGYKKMSCKITWTSKWKPSKKTIRNITQFIDGPDGLDWSYIGGVLYTVVDYKTGVNLEPKNKYGVTVKSKWGKTTFKDYYDNKGNWIEIGTKFTTKLTITYPSKYKNLCLGVGGNNVLSFSTSESQMKRDEEFFKHSDKEHSYTTTSYYKKGRKNIHFMRIK